MDDVNIIGEEGEAEWDCGWEIRKDLGFIMGYYRLYNYGIILDQLWIFIVLCLKRTIDLKYCLIMIYEITYSFLINLELIILLTKLYK